MKLTVILEPYADGGYTIVCPALPGVVSQGDSLEEALANIREAIELSLEVRQEDGLPGPIESPEIIGRAVEDCLKDREADGLPLTIETREVLLTTEVAAA